MVLSMDRWVGKVAVVTGASSGIGAAVAQQLVLKGLKVVGLARRSDRLDDIAKELNWKKGKFYSVKVDMSKEEDIINAFAWIKDHLGPVHILINNAGIGGNGVGLTESDTKSWNDIIKVNVIGLSIATREAIKDMRANDVDGHIIHINSILGHQIVKFPGLNMYPASKFAVTALAETLRLELNSLKSKIKITSISPGLVNTEILSAEFKRTPIFNKIVEDKCILEPDDVADAILYALSTPPHVQIQELTVRPIIEELF